MKSRGPWYYMYRDMFCYFIIYCSCEHGCHVTPSQLDRSDKINSIYPGHIRAEATYNADGSRSVPCTAAPLPLLPVHPSTLALPLLLPFSPTIPGPSQCPFLPSHPWHSYYPMHAFPPNGRTTACGYTFLQLVKVDKREL